MTAAGMSMHMAMINARASANALNREGGSREKSGSKEIWLTESEIENIRSESGRDNQQTSRNENSTTSHGNTKYDDENPLPKCSTCCTTM